MRQKSNSTPVTSENLVRDIRRAIAVSRVFGEPDWQADPSENLARNEHCQSVSSQVKNLIGARHFDASVGKMRRKPLHDVLFAVNKKGTLRAGLLLPSQQLRLIGMR